MVNAQKYQFTIGDEVEKFSGDYGGPGRIIQVMETWRGEPRYIVGFKIAGGFGEFYHILTEKQLRKKV